MLSHLQRENGEVWVRLMEGFKVVWVSAGSKIKSKEVWDSLRGLKDKNWWGSACEFILGRGSVLDDDTVQCMSKGRDGWSEVKGKVSGGEALGVRGHIHAGVGAHGRTLGCEVWQKTEPRDRLTNEVTTRQHVSQKQSFKKMLEEWQHGKLGEHHPHLLPLLGKCEASPREGICLTVLRREPPGGKVKGWGFRQEEVPWLAHNHQIRHCPYHLVLSDTGFSTCQGLPATSTCNCLARAFYDCRIRCFLHPYTGQTEGVGGLMPPGSTLAKQWKEVVDMCPRTFVFR